MGTISFQQLANSRRPIVCEFYWKCRVQRANITFVGVGNLEDMDNGLKPIVQCDDSSLPACVRLLLRECYNLSMNAGLFSPHEKIAYNRC